MRAIFTAAALCLLAVACGGSAAHESGTASAVTSSRLPGPEQPTLAIAWGPAGQGELFRADARTLKPMAGTKTVEIGSGGGWASAFSPDGRTLALGTGEPAAVQLIDSVKMRSSGRVKLFDDGYVDVVSWPTPDRIIVDLAAASALVAVVDPLNQRLLELHHLPGQVITATQTPTGLALLLARSQRIGPARLALVSVDGIRSVRLSEIEAGWESLAVGEDEAIPRQNMPGLAIDPSGRRALVVPAGDLVAEVDLETLAVRYHSLSEHVSLLGRLRNWLEPAADAKAISGPSRAALWLDEHLVAVAGADASTSSGVDGLDVTFTPAGLSFIDTADWNVRRIDDEASDMTLVGATLLAFGSSEKHGLVGYDSDGHERFRILKGEDVFDVHAAGDYVYVGSGNSDFFRVVDARSGQLIGTTSTAKPTTIIP
jgi:hypothetical protein